MSNEEQHKNVIAGKDNSIKIKGGLEVEGDLTLKGESAGLGGSGAFSEEEMRRLLSAGNVTVPAVEWTDGVESRSIKEGHIIVEHDLAQLLDTDKMNYRSIVLGARIKYDVTPNGSTSYTFSQNGVDTAVNGNTLNINFSGFRTGETVTFVNTSSSHPLEIIDSNDVVVATQSGKTTTWTPTATGSYKYRCQTHPTVMTGDMTVIQGADALFEIVGSTRSASNNPGSLDKDAHPEVFGLRFLVGPNSQGDPIDCRVTAIGLLGEYAVKTFNITVTNLLADDAPSWDDAPGSLAGLSGVVLERDNSGNEGAWHLGRMMAKRRAGQYDADGNIIDSSPATFTHPDRYEIESGDTAHFELVSGTFAGVASPQVLHGPDAGQALTDILKFKDTHPPDYEDAQSFSITIRAWNDNVIGAGDTAKYSDHTFTINITDSKWDNAPIWETASVGITCQEGLDTRPPDPWGGDGSPNGALNLRKYIKGTSLATNGSISTAGSDNPNAANYEFQIINGSGGTAGTSSAGSNVASTYFQIVPLDGENVFLSFQASFVDSEGINFETINSAWGGPTFYMNIRATNPLEGRAADKIVGVTIANNPDDDAPAWIGGGNTGGTASSANPVQVQEPQTGASFTWELNLSNLIDGDQTATTTFAIDVPYSDGDKFTLDGDNLKFITAPDYENPVDDQGDNLYSVKLTATNSAGIGEGDSGGKSSQQVVYIQVTDRTADNTAHWPSGVDTTHSINELSPNQTEVYTIPGGGSYTNDYVITSNPNIGGNTAPFHLAGPVIKTSGAIDLTNEQDTTFNLIIAARNADGVQGDTKTFAITVVNVLTDEFDMNNPFEFTVQP